jgi:hypothetical protein
VCVDENDAEVDRICVERERLCEEGFQPACPEDTEMTKRPIAGCVSTRTTWRSIKSASRRWSGSGSARRAPGHRAPKGLRLTKLDDGSKVCVGIDDATESTPICVETSSSGQKGGKRGGQRGGQRGGKKGGR